MFFYVEASKARPPFSSVRPKKFSSKPTVATPLPCCYPSPFSVLSSPTSNPISAEAGDQVEIQAARTHVFFHLFEIKLALQVDVIMHYQSIQIFFPDSLCLWI
jgi:hypothetical protein